MPSQAHHYETAERLLLAVEENPRNAAALALAHATLALVPRKALRGRHSRVTPNGDLPRDLRWGDE